MEPTERPDGNLVGHAKRELALIGEDQDVIDWYVTVIRAFAAFGHSGGSAMSTIPVLDALLRYQNLCPLTSDPAEWIDQSEVSGAPLWQSQRCPEAFSADGGQTYWLLSERDVCGSAETTPLHTAAPPPAG